MKTISQFTHCAQEQNGCGQPITKGDICFYTGHYIKHINCLQEAAQQTAKTNLSNTYVAMDAPQYGNIELRHATALDLRKQEKINQIQGYSPAKPDYQVFEPETQITSAQRSSIAEITDRVTQLTAALPDEENPPSITEADKVNEVLNNYLAEAKLKPQKQEAILSRIIELPALKKILELAEQSAKEPHNDLLYLIHLVGHPDTPKASIQRIQEGLIKSKANLESSLSDYSASHGEGLQELRTHLDESISIRLAAQ